MAKAKKKLLAPESYAPRILDVALHGVSGDHGIEWTWKSGPVEVTIEPSRDGEGDQHITIAVFDSLVGEEWRATPASAAKWAERKLRQIGIACSWGEDD